MKQIPDMEKKLETALDSLDGIQRAKPSPYFYTRLRARMARSEREWSGIAGLISKPVFALAIVSTVLLINAWIVISDKEEPISSVPKAISADMSSDEYNVAVATFYDYETP